MKDQEGAAQLGPCGGRRAANRRRRRGGGRPRPPAAGNPRARSWAASRGSTMRITCPVNAAANTEPMWACKRSAPTREAVLGTAEKQPDPPNPINTRHSSERQKPRQQPPFPALLIKSLRDSDHACLLPSERPPGALGKAAATRSHGLAMAIVANTGHGPQVADQKTHAHLGEVFLQI
uniref:Uncharacterized protein n=1 Tax=Sphaerodactylus townsendi TaxID=933632 RepID=A0ACB8ETV6_9SAUR